MDQVRSRRPEVRLAANSLACQVFCSVQCIYNSLYVGLRVLVPVGVRLKQSVCLSLRKGVCYCACYKDLWDSDPAVLQVWPRGSCLSVPSPPHISASKVWTWSLTEFIYSGGGKVVILTSRLWPPTWNFLECIHSFMMVHSTNDIEAQLHGS